MIDLDNFKHVNDLFGHPVGDAVLQEAGEASRNGLDGGRTVARLGGDEFAVIVPSLSTSPVIKHMLAKSWASVLWSFCGTR